MKFSLAALGLVLLMSPLANGADDVVIADFESDSYGNWTVEGDAFGEAPARADKLDVRGYRGRRLVNSFGRGDPATGTLTSPPFTISRTHLAFLIGGGRHDGETGIELLVDGKSVRTATGADSGDLRWVSWDVREFHDRQARVRIFDRATGGWGHINVDQIVLSDQARSGPGAWRVEDYRRSPDYYREPFRPAFHFTPELNWMNDPNGLVFYRGEYHLFYQHNPHGNSWGHMSWGHAVSPDMLHWKHLPIALHDEYGVMAFSGSAVVDWKNSSGFGTAREHPLVTIFTGHSPGRQTQDLAFSNDRGRTWTRYLGNPVLDIGESEFRDPKVFWQEPTKRWIMPVSLAVQKRLRFYGSPDLKQWTLLSEFGPAGVKEKLNWECPDLFELPIAEEAGGTRWVLKADMGSGAVAGGSGGEYFIGTFDGQTFTPDALESQWVDFGRDFYAPVSWSDVPASDGRRLWIGWMNNWETCLNPTYPWRSAMSVPREVTLRRIQGRLRLCQNPVAELKMLRGELTKVRDMQLKNSATPAAVKGQQFEIVAEFEVGSAREFGVHVLTGAGQMTIVGYDTRASELFVDRGKSGIVDFHKSFAGRHAGPLTVENRRVRLHIVVDRSSVEVFGNQGETAITDLVFPDAGSDGVEFYAREGDARLISCDIWPLASVWTK
ncbi:MAG: glycoside hydrolase family 32 protein [Planctomycetia bacterium]|nr:glycoside hydrolase family 32 protein [Planctomycetia bacterium]